MRIKKLGHCCLLIDTGKARVLTDPGSYTVDSQKDIQNIDIVLITHEHADHLHVESLVEIVRNNPGVQVITNSSVGKIIQDVEIEHTILEGRNILEISGVIIESFDGNHEEIFEEVGQVQNTGYFIDEKLFYPGDSYIEPKKDVDILALPVAGPWCKVPDAIRYALSVKPEKAFPVHDGMLEVDRIGGSHRIPLMVLGDNDIRFIPMVAGDEKEF